MTLETNQQVGLAVSQLVIEAMSNGLYCHQMAGILRDKIVEEYGVPAGHKVICCIAIGEYGDVATLQEPLDVREVAPRQRKSLAEIVFNGEWGQPANL